MSNEVLSDLARAKATFQLRTLVSVLGFPPLLDVQERFFHAVREGLVITTSPPCVLISQALRGRSPHTAVIDDPSARRPWVAPTVRRFAAGDAEAPGAETAVD